MIRFLLHLFRHDWYPMSEWQEYRKCSVCGHAELAQKTQEKVDWRSNEQKTECLPECPGWGHCIDDKYCQGCVRFLKPSPYDPGR